jgi:hypothetical protein
MINKKRFTITLDTRAFKELNDICKKQNKKISHIINILILQFLVDVKEGNIEFFEPIKRKKEGGKTHN